MVGSVFKSGNYFLVGLFGALLIGTVLGSPLPQQDDSSNEIDPVTISINEPSDRIMITTTERMSTSGSTTTERMITSSTTTTERMITSSTTTTEYPYNAIAKIYSPPPSKVGKIQYASGVLKFDVGHNEDYNKRALEEYNYHFARREMNLPPTTKRFNFAPPSKY
uniref:Uncharacterized protein n=1 Tax=Anopheles funestus TaxID=62324 RepID=A0A182RGH9_ANOFN